MLNDSASEIQSDSSLLFNEKKMMENDSIFYFPDSLLPLKKVKFPFAGYSSGTFGCHYLLCAVEKTNEHS